MPTCKQPKYILLEPDDVLRNTDQIYANTEWISVAVYNHRISQLNYSAGHRMLPPGVALKDMKVNGNQVTLPPIRRKELVTFDSPDPNRLAPVDTGSISGKFMSLDVSNGRGNPNDPPVITIKGKTSDGRFVELKDTYGERLTYRNNLSTSSLLKLLAVHLSTKQGNGYLYHDEVLTTDQINELADTFSALTARCISQYAIACDSPWATYNDRSSQLNTGLGSNVRQTEVINRPRPHRR